MVEGIELTSDEGNIFDLEFDRFLTTHFRQREMVDIVTDHRDYIKGSAQVAKSKFTGSTFGGVNAGSAEFGWTLIRPEWVGKTNWVANIAATGWADWIASAGSPTKMNKEALMTILGYGNYSASPKATAIKATIGGQITYPVQYIEYANRIGNVTLYETARPYRVLPEQTFNVRAKYDFLGVDEMYPFGIGFAKGTYLVTETPAVGT